MLRVLETPPHSLKVGYVLKRFPRLSETFILNEILELERQGTAVEIFSLLRPPAEFKHNLVENVQAPVTYLPGASVAGALTVRRTSGSGKLNKIELSQLIEPDGLPFDETMPGKSGAETTALAVKALTVAMLARARGINHLHAHFGSDATTVAMLAKRLGGLPFSFTAHARDIYHNYTDAKTDDRMRAAKIAEADFVVTVSEYNRRHLAGLVENPNASKIHRLYNGIDLQRFSVDARKRKPAHILAVGRLVEKKGFSDLIEAIRVLRANRKELTCTVVGDGPLRPALQEQIDQAGQGNVTTLAGPQPQERLIELMGHATLLALPCVVAESGDRDGLPTVLLEALASGLPCVSTNVAGIGEIIENGKTGLLVPPRTPHELAQALHRLLSSPGLRSKFSTTGRAKAERDFDLSQNVQILKSLFEACNHGTSTQAGAARA